MRPALALLAMNLASCSFLLSESDSAGSGDAAPGADAPLDDAGPRSCEPDCFPGNVATFGNVITVSNSRLRAEWTFNDNYMLSFLATPGAPTVNLLYTGGDIAERLAAVARFSNSGTTTSVSSEGMGSPVLEILENGPAITQFAVTWATDADLQGTTTYTIHPDGRLHRSELFTSASGLANDFVTGFVALDASLVAELDWSHTSGGPFDPIDIPARMDALDAQSTDGFSCARLDNGGSVAFGWLRTDPFEPWAGPRLTSNAPEQVALQVDWVRTDPSSADFYLGALSIAVGPIAGQGPCGALGSLLASTQRPLSIMVINGSIDTASDDGDSGDDGFNELGGFWQVVVGDSSPLTVDFDSDGSQVRAENIALRIRGTAGLVPSVTVDGDALTRDVDFVFQSNSEEDLTWLFIAEQAVSGTSLSITFE